MIGELGMSIVVAVKKNNKIVLAADTLSMSGSTKCSSEYILSNSKIIKIKDSYIGLIGSTASYNVFESIKMNYIKDIKLSNAYEIFETFRKLHPVLKDKYFTLTDEKDDHQEYESNQITSLIINKNGIFEMETYREVIQYNKFWAICAGYRFSLGAMYAIYDEFDDALEIAKIGVNAACEFEESCGLPMEYFEIDL